MFDFQEAVHVPERSCVLTYSVIISSETCLLDKTRTRWYPIFKLKWGFSVNRLVGKGFKNQEYIISLAG